MQRKKAKATPDLAEWKKQFGDKVKVDEQAGTFSIDLTDRQDIRRAHEMQQGARDIEIERGDLMQSRMKREKLIRKSDGKMVEFPEELVEQAKSKFRPAGRNGNAPAVRFGLSEIYKDFEQGPDGLWFRWDDGWLATNFWRRDAKSPQRDPDGNVWIEVAGETGPEWVLEDEVA